jgi:hypothetical protein
VNRENEKKYPEDPREKKKEEKERAFNHLNNSTN